MQDSPEREIYNNYIYNAVLFIAVSHWYFIHEMPSSYSVVKARKFRPKGILSDEPVAISRTVFRIPIETRKITSAH